MKINLENINKSKEKFNQSSGRLQEESTTKVDRVKSSFFSKLKNYATIGMIVGGSVSALAQESSNKQEKSPVVTESLKSLDDTIEYHPGIDWKFKDNDSLEAIAPTKYAGINEYYIKHFDSEDGLYKFLGYEDLQGKDIDLPEYIEDQIKGAKERVENLSNEEYVNKYVAQQLIFQETPEFLEKIIKRQVELCQQQIDQITARIEYNKEDKIEEGLEDNLKELAMYENTVNHLKNDQGIRKEIHDERKLSEQGIREASKFELKKNIELLKSLEQKLQNVLDYIKKNE